MVGFGGILAGAGLLASAVGGSKNKGGEPQKQGFQAYPPEIQEYLLQTVLPQIQQRGQRPFESIPMQRVKPPGDDIHASPELYALQQYSDAVGGLFNPVGGQPSAPIAPPAADPRQNASLAAQYIQDTRGGPHSPGSRLGTAISTGQTDLASIGDALLGEGFSASTPVSNVDYTALYRALGL